MKNERLIKVLKASYKEAVMAYIRAFEKKQDVKFKGWVNDDFGQIAYMGIVLINFNAIRYDINVNAPKNAYIDYYDHMYINKDVNYPNWLKMVHGIKRYYYFEDE